MITDSRYMPSLARWPAQTVARGKASREDDDPLDSLPAVEVIALPAPSSGPVTTAVVVYDAPIDTSRHMSRPRADGAIPYANMAAIKSYADTQRQAQLRKRVGLCDEFA
jgi:hypothetical protein